MGFTPEENLEIFKFFDQDDSGTITYERTHARACMCVCWIWSGGRTSCMQARTHKHTTQTFSQTHKHTNTCPPRAHTTRHTHTHSYDEFLGGVRGELNQRRAQVSCVCVMDSSYNKCTRVRTHSRRTCTHSLSSWPSTSLMRTRAVCLPRPNTKNEKRRKSGLRTQYVTQS